MSKVVGEHAHKQPRVHDVIVVQSLFEHVNPRLSTYILQYSLSIRHPSTPAYTSTASVPDDVDDLQLDKDGKMFDFFAALALTGGRARQRL